MRAAMPLKNTTGTKSIIADDFRSADMIGIYDMAKDAFNKYDIGKFTSDGSLTAKLHELAVDSIIACNIMPLAFRAFEDEGISCYLPCGTDLSFNIQMYSKNNLPLIRNSAERNSLCAPDSCSSCSGDCGNGENHAGE